LAVDFLLAVAFLAAGAAFLVGLIGLCMPFSALFRRLGGLLGSC
jgi:hypothetical protein